MSTARQREEQNDQRLLDLAGKITSLRNVTNDIHGYAEESGLIDSASETMGNLFNSLKGTSSRLTRSMQAGHPIFKTAGLILIAFFVIYSLSKLF